MQIFTPTDVTPRTRSQTRIDVWHFSLLKPLEDARSLLDNNEIERADRFYFEHHRRRFIAAHAGLRRILALYTGVCPEKLVFSTNHYGKPHLMDADGLTFNLSHSADSALVAVGQDFPLGVDIEYFSCRNYRGIARHSFSPEENAVLERLPSWQRAMAFFHIWAQKEAFIKAAGMGLSYPTTRFTVPARLPLRAEVLDPLADKHWQMRGFTPFLACAAALCCDTRVKDVAFLRLPEHE
ncbi:4'-phosphopantetheinyl transferase superfamily protein [Legionella geestiana]|uniref:4'-phosphopantetheinyl transferase family protein n=1 Tax=Legionella geestiana TaxID=45065 RepID=UPI0010932EB7|nr:4'-phosphopantetheinyl transferase superfamily protein [Legionella geestiana]QDQ40649.1 4'-phosphopantetheinyl transferase superfamily protein [Legionella geestiana]